MPARRTALLTLVLAAGWLTSAAALPLPYEANYSVYRNGKLIGMLDIALEIEDGRWQIRSRASGTLESAASVSLSALSASRRLPCRIARSALRMPAASLALFLAFRPSSACWA